MNLDLAIQLNYPSDRINDLKIINSAAQAVISNSNILAIINSAADRINTPSMPYKSQAILEEVIRLLELKV